MWAYYAIALIPVFVGAILWIASRRITLGEWIRGSLVGFAIAGSFHYYTITFPALDVEMHSGRVVNAVHRPRRQTATRSRTDATVYEECWFATVALADGEERFGITQAQFEHLRGQFGAETLTPVQVPGEFVGDPHNYIAANHNDVFIPAYTLRPYRNRARVDQGIQAFSDPPPGTRLFDHPSDLPRAALLPYFISQPAARNDASERIPIEAQCFDWRRSNRLLGHATEHYSLPVWDRLNAELGPVHDVNLIIVGFDGDSMLAHWQEAKWLGGKRNDLVLCYGPPTNAGTPAWTYCFGGAENELVKRNLETLLLDNTPGDALVAKIKNEVLANYHREESPVLGYFEIRPPSSAILMLMVVMVITQGGYWIRAYTNRRDRAAVGKAELQEVAYEQVRDWDRIRENSVKERIAERLGHLDDPTDVAQLTEELLSGTDAYTACLALQACGKPEAITSLIVALSAAQHDVRELATDWLHDHTPTLSSCVEAKAALPVLIDRSAHENPEVRAAARTVLDELEPDWGHTPAARRGTESMLQVLRSGKATDSVTDALGARGELVVDDLLGIIDEDRGGARIAAIKALGATGYPRVAGTLLKYLDDHAPDVRKAAIDGLARFGPALKRATGGAQTYELLATLFENGDRETRLQVARAFGWLGDERAVEPVAGLLRDRDWSVRVAAAQVLGHLGSFEALPYLFACADDVDDYAAADAIAAIGVIGGDAIVDRVIELFERHPDAGSRFTDACIRVVGCSSIANARQWIEAVANDFGHAGNELAMMFARRSSSERNTAQAPCEGQEQAVRRWGTRVTGRIETPSSRIVLRRRCKNRPEGDKT